MSAAPVAPRRPRQNGNGRFRPPLTPVTPDAPNQEVPVAVGPQPARPSQAVASERSPLGRVVTGPRTGLFLLTAVGLLLVAEFVLWLIPFLRILAWGIGLVTAVGAAMAGVAAAHGARGRARKVWLLTGAASASILLGMLARGLPSLDPTTAPTFGRDDAGFVMAVIFFVLAATIRLDGERTGARRLRMLLDVVILSLSPSVFALVVTSYTDLLGPRDVLLAPGGLLYLSAYVATAYAMFWVTRRTAFARPSSPQGLLAWGTLSVAAGAALHAGQLLRMPLWEIGLGQPFWIVGLAGIALGALTVARVPDAEVAHSPPEGDSRDDSRLRMIPATGAGMLVFLALTGHMLSDRPPSGELFVCTLGLSVLLVVRLMLTLGENGWLLRRLETSGHAEERLRDLGLALNLQASLDMERVLELVCRQGRAALRADNVVMWLVDAEAGEIRAVESAGVRRDILRDRRISVRDRASLAARVVRTRAPEIVQHASTARRSHALLTVLLRQQCLMAVPLLRHRETIGAIVFGSTRLPESFQERDISRAELLAAQAMVAMENARLYGEARGQLEETTALYEIASAARDALTSEDLAQALVEILKTHVGYDRASILLSEERSPILRPVLVDERVAVAGAGRTNGQGSIGTLLPSSLASQASRTGKPVTSEPTEERPVAMLAVPMLLKEGSVGVIELERAERPFDPNEERVVAALANHVALAINNLQLAEHAR
ncbi:MAG: GAF domain-containing protein, partial [Chloroflexota bacterium]